MSTPVFVDPEISTQPDVAQSSRVPVPLPEDPYEAIRQAYLDGTDTESEPFEDPIETETPESPHTIAPPTSLPESTSSTLVPILVVAAMSESAFHKRFRSSYESSPSSSSPDLPLRKRYWGTSELVEDDDEDDEEIEKSLDSNNVSEDAKDEGPTIEDEDPAIRDEGLAAGDEGPGDAIPEGQQRAVLVVGTAVIAPLGLGYWKLRHRELELEEDIQPTLTTWTDLEDGMVYIDVPAYPPPASPVQTPPSPEWSSGSLPISSAPSIVPSPISSPMIPLTVPSLVVTPATAETEGFLTELGAQVKMSGAVRDEIFSQRYRFRSLEHEQERVTMTFGALWRPVLALESWAGQTDAHRAALWHAINDTQGENQELRLQLAEERRAQLELAGIVGSM
ncbi:hypothetical protein Tco_0999961, partial [Tanacetum coccineum]